MALSRRVETFTAGYVGFSNEATAFTDETTDDMDSPPALTNYALHNRVKQYFGMNDAITVKTGTTVVGSATVADPTTYTLQRLGGFVRFLTAQAASTKAWISGKYIPMYFMRGARNVGNNSTTAKIDTTGSGDAYMNAVPGRPDATAAFTLVTGPKITNAAGKSVTIESMLMTAQQKGVVCVFSFQDDTTDATLPRDVMYSYVGNGNKTRQMNAAVERAFDGFLAYPDDGNLPVQVIDYIA